MTERGPKVCLRLWRVADPLTNFITNAFGPVINSNEWDRPVCLFVLHLFGRRIFSASWFYNWQITKDLNIIIGRFGVLCAHLGLRLCSFRRQIACFARILSPRWLQIYWHDEERIKFTSRRSATGPDLGRGYWNCRPAQQDGARSHHLHFWTTIFAPSTKKAVLINSTFWDRTKRRRTKSAATTSQIKNPMKNENDNETSFGTWSGSICANPLLKAHLHTHHHLLLHT